MPAYDLHSFLVAESQNKWFFLYFLFWVCFVLGGGGLRFLFCFVLVLFEFWKV